MSSCKFTKLYCVARGARGRSSRTRHVFCVSLIFSRKCTGGKRAEKCSLLVKLAENSYQRNLYRDNQYCFQTVAMLRVKALLNIKELWTSCYIDVWPAFLPKYLSRVYLTEILRCCSLSRVNSTTIIRISAYTNITVLMTNRLWTVKKSNW